MSMNPKLQTMLAQYEQGQARVQDILVESERAKAPKRPAPAPAPVAAAPVLKMEESSKPEGGKTKLKLKGAANGFVPAPKVTTTASLLAASTHATAVALDPTTAVLGKRVKDVLDCLHANNGSQLTPLEILQRTQHNLAADGELLRALHTHPRVVYEGGPSTAASAAAAAAAPPPTAPAGWYMYRPEIEGVRDKVTLLNFVRDLKGRAALLSTLKATYLKAEADLQALKAEGKVFILGHPEPGMETVFSCEMMGMNKVGEDVRSLWFEVAASHVKDRVPQGVQELQAAVTRAGLRSALAHQPVKRTAAEKRERPKKPRQQRFKIEKATNAHLPFLFAGAQPKNIDS